MNRKFSVVSVIALLCLGGLAVAAWTMLKPTDERTQLLLNDTRGVVTSGSKLGVRIGDPWQEADATIRSQFEPDYVLWTVEEANEMGRNITTFPGGPVLTGKAKVSYRDRSWRNGVVTLDLRDGLVVAITWHYSGPFYIDL